MHDDDRVAVEQWENASSQKDFEKAQFYREQEMAARENLQFVREKFDVKSSTRKVVVGKAELADFHAEVDRLRQRADRLQARTERLAGPLK